MLEIYVWGLICDLDKMQGLELLWFVNGTNETRVKVQMVHITINRAHRLGEQAQHINPNKTLHIHGTGAQKIYDLILISINFAPNNSKSLMWTQQYCWLHTCEPVILSTFPNKTLDIHDTGAQKKRINMNLNKFCA